MSRRRFTWTDHQVDKLNKVQKVLSELHEFKPLTLRQVYYQLVGKGYIENKVSQYNMLSKLLKWSRIDGLIGWDDIEDRIRAYHNLTGWEDESHFIDQVTASYLEGYRRDLLQSQSKYIEIWIEKDALASIFIRAASKYRIPVVVCRGFSSVSFLNEYKTRLNYKHLYKPVLLYFGDFDPSGMEMLDSMKITLEQELNVNSVAFKRIALSRDDIFDYNLPHSPEALKRTDSRAVKHLAAHGELAVELDALRPDILTRKIDDAVLNEIDIDLFNAEVEQQDDDLKRISELKNKVREVINGFNY